MLGSIALESRFSWDFRGRPGIALHRTGSLFFALTLVTSGWAIAADLEEAQKLYRTGHYDACLRLVNDELASDLWNEPLRHLKIKCLLARGRYPDAQAALEEALTTFPASISLHLLGREVYRVNGNERDASGELGAIDRLIQTGARRYATPEGCVTIGRFYLLRGSDARKVLDQFYDPVTKQQPDFLDGYYATAELALEKEDYALAAETLRKAPKAAAADPRFHYLLARALAAEDRAGSAKEVAEALKINPHDADSLLLKADQLIDGERYKEADQILQQVLDVNPRESRAWAYRAVLAHLRGDQEGEASARESALAHLAVESRGQPAHRAQAFSEIPLCRGGRTSKASAGVGPRLHAREGPALPGSSATGRRNRRLEARC